MIAINPQAIAAAILRSGELDSAQSLVDRIEAASISQAMIATAARARGGRMTAAEDARYTAAEREEEQCRARLHVVIKAQTGVDLDTLAAVA